MMTDQSQTVSRLLEPRRADGLSPGQRSLVELMQVHQFGWIENMSVRAGQPILNGAVKSGAGRVIRWRQRCGEGHPHR